MTTSDAIVVPELYSGYPQVAFGGYVAGVLAQRSGASAVRVDFRGPVPVEVPVRIAETADGGVELGDSERPLAVGRPAELPVDAPAAPSWDEAAAAADKFRAAPPSGVVDCFGCGLRAADRGLRVYCGPVPDLGLVASAWVRPASSPARTACSRPSWSGARWTARGTGRAASSAPSARGR